MNITILAVGKVREKYFGAGTTEYIKRLRPFIIIQEVELEAAGFDKKNQAKAREIEAERIRSYLEKRNSAETYLLDEEGEEYSSLEFSELLKGKKGQIIFVAGGALGFAKELKVQYRKISLSRMTFPHELARLVLLEQVYRAVTIIIGKTYHY